MCEHCPERGSLCPNCGADPCYHLCHNSVAYYSPEQERADEPWYGMDDERERYAATVEPSQYDGYIPCPDCGDEDPNCTTHYVPERDDPTPAVTDNTDDVPF